MQQTEKIFFRISLAVAVAAISYLATAPLDAVPLLSLGDKVLHAAAFLLLAALLDYSFPASAFTGAKISTLLVYGIAIEITQHFLPFRSFSLLDWLADAGGVSLYVVAATPLLKRTPWLRRRWAYLDSP